MTTTPAGPAKPDPTQPILVGAARPAVPRPPQPVAQPAVRTPPGPPPAPPVPPPHPGTPVPPRRRPTGLIAVVVVLAVVVMGLGGVALRPYLSGTTGTPATPGQTVPSHPSPTPSADPTRSQTVWGPYAGEVFVPYDLGADVPAGATPTVLGIWGDIAVFSVGDFPDPVTLVFVDVTDGRVTGSMRTTPDGAAFRVISSAADYHTLMLEVSEAPYPGTFAADGTPVCPGTISLLQVSLTQGGVVKTGSWQPTCTPVEGGLSVAAPRLTAYRNGMVVMTDVVDVIEPGSPFGLSTAQRTLAATEGYRETYLAEPVWRVEGAGPQSTYRGVRVGSDVTKTNDDGLVPGFSPMLLDDWVMSATGEYVELRTGEPTGWRVQPQTIPDFWIEVAGGQLYTTTSGPGPTSVSLWSAPTDKAPVWTYTRPSGDAVWGFWGNRPWSCQSDDIGIDRVVTGPQAEGMVQMTAVDLATGKKLWSRVDAALGMCAIATVGDQEVIGLWTGSGVQFVDATTGQVTGPPVAWPGGVTTDDSEMALYPCGFELVCAVPGGSATVTVASFSPAGGTAKIEGTVTLANMDYSMPPWDAGTRYVLVGRDDTGHPCFVLL